MIKNFPMIGLQRSMEGMSLQPEKEFGFNPQASVATFGAFNAPKMVWRQGQSEPLRAPFQGMPGSAGVPLIGAQNTRRNPFYRTNQPQQWWGNPIPSQSSAWPAPSAAPLQSSWPAPAPAAPATLFGAPPASGFGQWGSTAAPRPPPSSGFGASSGAFGSFTGVQPTWGAPAAAPQAASPWGSSGFGAPAASSSASPWGVGASPWGKPASGRKKRGGKGTTKKGKKGKKQTKKRNTH